MKKAIIAFLFLIFLLQSCTENVNTKHFGGTQTIVLEKNEIFINASWKKESLWVATKDTLTGVCYFREKSSFGFWEGKIVVMPQK